MKYVESIQDHNGYQIGQSTVFQKKKLKQILNGTESQRFLKHVTAEQNNEAEQNRKFEAVLNNMPSPAPNR